MKKIMLLVVLLSSFSFSNIDCGDKISCAKIGLEFRKIGNIEKANEAFTTSCDLGLALSCSMMGARYEKEKDFLKSIKMYTKGCELNDAIGCKYLGDRLIKDKKIEEGISSLKKSCKLKEYSSCEKIGAYYIDGKIIKSDYKKGYSYMDKACNQGKREKACKVLSIMTDALINSKSK